MTRKEFTAITQALRSVKPSRPTTSLTTRDLSNWVGAEKQWQVTVSHVTRALHEVIDPIKFADACYGIEVTS